MVSFSNTEFYKLRKMWLTRHFNKFLSAERSCVLNKSLVLFPQTGLDWLCTSLLFSLTGRDLAISAFWLSLPVLHVPRVTSLHPELLHALAHLGVLRPSRELWLSHWARYNPPVCSSRLCWARACSSLTTIYFCFILYWMNKQWIINLRSLLQSTTILSCLQQSI